MAFRLWNPKSQSPHPPPLVALNPAPARRDQLASAASSARIPFATAPPATGDYILALEPTQLRPSETAPHIPVIDASSTDIVRLLEEALLYLEAHHRLKQ